MTRRVLMALAAVAACAAFVPTADAQRWRPEERGERREREWELLGSAQIGTRIERDIIEVGRREGRFGRIGFEVRGNDVRIESLKIVYGNGESEDLRVGQVYKDGTRSAPIDLQGRGRAIQRIEVLYRSPGAVKIDFYGEPGGWREPQWVEVGCQRVGFLDDRDVIRATRRDGRFSAIKLKVTDAKLRLQRLKVVFENGASQTFDVRSVIPEGTETNPIDLDGRDRAIDRIELYYLPQISLKRGATVCVSGREDGDRRGPPGRWRDR